MYLSISFFLEQQMTPKKEGHFYDATKCNATIIINIFWQKEKKVQKFVKTTYLDCFHLHSRYVLPISVDSHDPLNLILALYATRTKAQMTSQIMSVTILVRNSK